MELRKKSSSRVDHFPFVKYVDPFKQQKNPIINMGTPFFHELKKQASFFLKEKIKTARLALTDVTPAQVMTEEATNENTWPPDTHTFGVISKAAFEVDDYWRIVEIIQRRLLNFDRKNWRGAYKALILLEHLLTHGPLSIAEEFQEDKDVINQMRRFQYIDEKGFNWGVRVNKLSERVLKLMENTTFLREERVRARNLTREIQGFGSFSNRSSIEASLKDFPFKAYGRCNSQYNDHQSKDSKFFNSNETFYFEDGMRREEGDHPFCESEHQTTESLLSSLE